MVSINMEIHREINLLREDMLTLLQHLISFVPMEAPIDYTT